LGGGGPAQRPVLRGNELKKTGARSAQVRTRGQNPLVTHISDGSYAGVIKTSAVLCVKGCYFIHKQNYNRRLSKIQNARHKQRMAFDQHTLSRKKRYTKITRGQVLLFFFLPFTKAPRPLPLPPPPAPHHNPLLRIFFFVVFPPYAQPFYLIPSPNEIICFIFCGGRFSHDCLSQLLSFFIFTHICV
jgi:hypothetical protein